MLQFRQSRRDSWFDAAGAKRLGADLASRLAVVCAGRRGLFLTLTYRRDAYNDSRECFRAAAEERHVRAFIDDLGEYLKGAQPDLRQFGDSGREVSPLSGRWFCKMEFQAGGWVHWHLILLDVNRVEHNDLAELWGRGHVWVERLKRSTVGYLAKYVAKVGTLPTWVYLEPVRSIKVVRVSPGFWGDTGESRAGGSSSDSIKLPIYRCIGEVVERGLDSVDVRDDRGRYVSLPVPLWVVAAFARAHGYRVLRGPAGWLTLGIEWELLERWAARGFAAGGLHSIDGGLPRQDKGRWLRWCIQDVLSWQFEPRESEAA